MIKMINGRAYGDRTALMERTGLSRSALARLWADRDANGHPDAVREGKWLLWDLELWETWHSQSSQQRREVDRSGDPDEELPPAQQARVLGFDISAISQYRKNPPPGWPAPVRTEVLPSGRVREYRTRRQLWAYSQSAPRAGVGGGRKRDPDKAQSQPYQGDPRLDIARQALADHLGKPVSAVAVSLAERHGGSTRTWERILTASQAERDHPQE